NRCARGGLASGLNLIQVRKKRTFLSWKHTNFYTGFRVVGGVTRSRAFFAGFWTRLVAEAANATAHAYALVVLLKGLDGLAHDVDASRPRTAVNLCRHRP